MFAQFEAVLLKDKPQFQSPSLKSAGHRNCPVERSFCEDERKSRDSSLCSCDRDQRGHLWDHTLVHKERVSDFRSQDFCGARYPLAGIL